MLFKWNLQPDYFNPRSHEGSDTLEKYIYATGTDFNPRSHEGSDWNTVEINRNHYGFQSALPRGERRCGSTYSGRYRINFNPRSHEGSDA